MVPEATSPFSDLFAQEDPATARILETAHRMLFAHGYQAFTMDELAHELGMSKKTLYVHFSSKDEIVERIIDALGDMIGKRLRAVVGNSELTFPQKLAGIVEVVGGTVGRVNQRTFRELQRFTPKLYAKVDALRVRTIPVIFGQLLRAGIAEGKVRADVDPEFATEFWLHAIRGMVQPETLERTGLSLPQTMAKALNLFFAGLLTPAGRKEYEKHG